MNRNTGQISLIGQNKAQPRVPGSCFVLSEAPRPLGTNCAAQRVLVPGGLSRSLLDYHSQLPFQKHLFLFRCFNSFRTHARVCTRIQKPGFAFPRGLEHPGVPLCSVRQLQRAPGQRVAYLWIRLAESSHERSGSRSVESVHLHGDPGPAERGEPAPGVLSPFGSWSSNL